MPARRRKDPANPSLGVAYLRVSTDEQRLGPEAQRADIERWTQQNGVQVASWHVDQGVSGGAALERRTALLEALDDLRERRAGLLIVAKRDRLARDVMVAAMVERLVEREGARVVSADGTGNVEGPEGQLMRGLMDLFAQYERAVIRARTRAALAVKKRRGERVGTVPFGFAVGADGVKLQEDPDEQAIIAKIQEYRAEGETLRAIVKRLNKEGVPCRGKRWHLTSVVRVLDSA